MKKKMLTAVLGISLVILTAGCGRGPAAVQSSASVKESSAVSAKENSAVSAAETSASEGSVSAEEDQTSAASAASSEAALSAESDTSEEIPEEEYTEDGEIPEEEYVEDEEIPEEEYAEDESAFVYSGSDPYLPAVCAWMTEELGQYYSSGAITIPEPVILYTDNSNPDDIKIWGDFRIGQYNLDNETLVFAAGGSHPGLLHLKEADDMCTVTGFDAVGEGSDNGPDIERIFGSAPAAAGDLPSVLSKINDDGTAEAARKDFLRMYAEASDLSITAYQDYGYDPVSLQ